MNSAAFVATWAASDTQFLVVWAGCLLLSPAVWLAWRYTGRRLAQLVPLTGLALAWFILPVAAVLAAWLMATWEVFRPRTFWRWLLPLALAVRLPLALIQPAWYDETFSAAIAAVPLERLPTAILADVHPPLPYLVTWLTARIFGPSEFALRLPSLIAGLLLIVLLYRLAYQLGCYANRARALDLARVTALLAAFMPSLVYYSTDNRYPVILACVVVGAALAVVGSHRRAFVLMVGLLPWLHADGFIYAGVFLALALALGRRRWLVPVALAAGIGGLWLPFMALQARDVANGFWLITISPLWHVVDMTFNLNAPNQSLAIIILITVALTLAALYHWRQFVRMRPGVVWLAVVFGPPVGEWLVSLAWHPVYLPRTLLGSAAVLLIGWSWLIVGTAEAVRRLAFRLVVIALALSFAGLILRGPRTTIPTVFNQCASADYVYVSSTNMAIMALYYAPAPVIVWPSANDINQSLSADGKAALGMVSQPLDELRGEVCYVFQLSPNTSAKEYLYWSFMTAGQRYRESIIDEFLSYRVVRLHQ